MCVIVQYLCPKCKETGQRDYLCHTDGQWVAIPAPRSLKWDAAVEIISYCPDVQPYRAIIQGPLIQSPEFRCMSSSFSGYKVQFNDKKHPKQEARILEKLRHHEYIVTREGNSVMDVKEMLELKEIKKMDIQKLPGSKLQKWTLYTEEKLKKMTAKGDSYKYIKTTLKGITGLNYITYEIIAKAASFNLYDSLFPPDPPRRATAA